MRKPKKVSAGFIIIGGVMSLNAAVLLAILFWQDTVKDRFDVEPRFTSGWRLPKKPVKVATFNVGMGKRLDECIELLKSEEPDIVCMQEILQEDVSRVESGLGMKGCWFGATNMSANAFYGKALFARGKLTEPQSMPHPEGGSYGVWAVVEIHEGRFLAGSIHLRDLKAPRAGYPARESEIRSMQEAVKKIGAPALLAGDFNNPSISVNYDQLTEEFIDLAPDSGATHATRLPLIRVDFIVGTQDWESVSSKKLKAVISDHFPVVAVVRPKLEARIREKLPKDDDTP